LTLNPTSGIVLCVEDDVSDDSLPGDGSPPKKEMVAIHHLFTETGFGKDAIRIFGIVGIPRDDNSPLHVVELQTSWFEKVKPSPEILTPPAKKLFAVNLPDTLKGPVEAICQPDELILYKDGDTVACVPPSVMHAFIGDPSPEIAFKNVVTAIECLTATGSIINDGEGEVEAEEDSDRFLNALQPLLQFIYLHTQSEDPELTPIRSSSLVPVDEQEIIKTATALAMPYVKRIRDAHFPSNPEPPLGPRTGGRGSSSPTELLAIASRNLLTITEKLDKSSSSSGTGDRDVDDDDD
jgi:hypothetical protein